MYLGNFLGSVHYDVREIPVESIPVDNDEALHRWMLKWKKNCCPFFIHSFCSLWAEKDVRLEKYYNQQSRSTRHLEAKGNKNTWVCSAVAVAFNFSELLLESNIMF